ncbi:DUF5320 domain-containing protein [Calycomorphotria hydatis]|uniref:Uncharacterized protein n=1 Tax=Calycomorphotria hydatis TaxID=2528027 RepID=A0A517TEF8_9PLAN|nr:DUF5320 domain-containing protein [Calycomorphotria hydatis]QDT66756.1 hypothetical protein V22_40270 [Calycomorphotria hydatis]
MLKKFLFVVIPFSLIGGAAVADDDIFAELENFDAESIVELDTEDFDLDIDELSAEAFDINELAVDGEELAEELCGFFRYRRYGWGRGYRGFGYRNYGCYNRYYSCYRPCYNYYRVCYPVYRSYWCW